MADKQTKGLIGIDIGNSMVSMAQLTSAGAKLHVKRMPDNLVSGERIVSPETMSRFLREMKAEGGFSGSKCTVILPEDGTYFRTVTMPPVGESQLKLNLPYEFRDYVGGDGSEYFYDYAVKSVERDEDGAPTSLSVFAAATRKDALEQMASVLRRAGLRLKVAVPREMSLIYLLRAAVDSGVPEDREYCIVEADYDHTHVNIARGRHLTASKTIDVGCRQIDEAIASLYNIDVYLAASYRESNYEDVLATEACRAIYDRISLEITKAVNFYKYENPQSDLDDIRFCGMGAADPRLASEIVDYIGLSEYPMAGILPASCASNPDAPHCAIAIGAVL